MSATYNATQNNRNLEPDGPTEKDFSRSGRHEHLDTDIDADDALRRIRTTGSLSISPELFEKLYLSPQNRIAGDLRKTFGNPTPLALCGFLLSLTPLSCDLMGWRGAGGSGAASTAAYLFFGGLLMILGAVGEWIIGNTFPFVVFGSFGAFWLTFAGTLIPAYNSYGAYSTTGSVADGLKTVGFQASFAFFLLWMGVLCFVYMICALRTNVVFFLIFAFLVPSFGCLAGAYWQLAQGNIALYDQLIVAGGALTFIVDILGWWIFVAIMLASLDFPFQVPVGDLTHIIRGASDRAKARGGEV
ncbi:hypothetical protein AMS68_006694 [Peltaster fructicola]|uniref:GPR1/FUN34/YaaH-class plasma membrane protein n=1 Tax=Peltaster fructicola TaxID=286661 RepID=A0A6H0Y2E8_9PEZI|nr:hypothetical protein AMS68_006694 [Peltaster fructicola]